MFFVLEGPNGCGKTSVLKALSDKGYDTFESPGGTPLAKELRPMCRGTPPWVDCDPLTRMLLFSAARQDEFKKRVQGKQADVIAGRWWTSTYVYQTLYQGLSVAALESTIDPHEKIDCLILLTAPFEVLVARVKAEREANPDHGRCAWTQKFEETLKALLPYYEQRLPQYMLDRWGVPTVTIQTGEAGLEYVTALVEQVIKNQESK